MLFFPLIARSANFFEYQLLKLRKCIDFEEHIEMFRHFLTCIHTGKLQLLPVWGGNLPVYTGENTGKINLGCIYELKVFSRCNVNERLLCCGVGE